MDRYYKIAGLTVKMNCFDRVEHFARPYEIDPISEVDITLDPDWEAVKRKYPADSDGACYYTSSAIQFYQKLTKFNAMLLHSSAVAIDGKAYLFSADPGTGKSTHTTLWRKVFGDERVRILNDDKPAVRKEHSVWYAYGTPWSGKTSQNLNLKYPLAGIAFLQRGTENSIMRYDDTDLVLQFLKQTSKPIDSEMGTAILDNIDDIIRNVPVWKLTCNISAEAAIVAYEAMSGQKYEGDWK